MANVQYEYKKEQGPTETDLNRMGEEGWRVAAVMDSQVILERQKDSILVLGPWYSPKGDKYHFMLSCGYREVEDKVPGRREASV